MPIYVYHCSDCESSFEVFRSIDAMQQQEPCTCGALAHKTITVPMVRGDLSAYSCPITGKWIDGRKAHENNLKKHGCRVYETGETTRFMKEKAKRHEEATEALLDRILPKTLGDTING